MTIEAVIFYLLLLDSIMASLVSLLGRRWYMHHFRLISRLFPLAKGWALYYFVLVLWIGWLTYAAGLL